MSEAIIYFFKDFRTNQYGINIESEIANFSVLLPFSDDKIIGGVLTKSIMKGFQDYFDILLREEDD